MKNCILCALILLMSVSTVYAKSVKKANRAPSSLLKHSPFCGFVNGVESAQIKMTEYSRDVLVSFYFNITENTEDTVVKIAREAMANKTEICAHFVPVGGEMSPPELINLSPK